MKKLLTLLLSLCMLLSLTACGSKDTGDTTAPAAAATDAPASLEEIFTELVNYKDMTRMVQMTPDMMLGICGIRDNDIVTAQAAICATGLEAHEIWVLEAKDAASLAHLQELAQQRVDQKGEETKTYSPEQYKMVEKAQIVTSGNYLALVIAPNAQEMADYFLDSVA